MAKEGTYPLVSVIIPTYTEKRPQIKRAIESVAEQSYGAIQLVVVDSANREWLEAYCAEANSHKYVTQDPHGVSAARNLGLDIADGDIIAFLDADDYYAEQKLELQVSHIKNGADVVYSDAYSVSNCDKQGYRESFSAGGMEQFYTDFFRYDGKKGNIPTSTIAIRESLLGDMQFDEQLAGGEDYHLWIRLFKNADRIDHIDQPLAYIRSREESLSSDSDMMYENRLKAIELLCEQYPELRPYQRERELQEQYDYARHLLFDGRTDEARSIFLKLLVKERYARSAPMLGVSLLPFGRYRIVEALDTLYAEVR